MKVGGYHAFYPKRFDRSPKDANLEVTSVGFSVAGSRAIPTEVLLCEGHERVQNSDENTPDQR